MNAYQMKEATTGAKLAHQMAERKLDPNWHDSGRHLAQEIAGNRATQGAEWVLNGTYGSEYFYLMQLRMDDLPTTAKRRAQAVRRIAIEAYMIAALADHSDLNARKITQIVKDSGRMDVINAAIVAYIEEMIADKEAKQ